MDTEDNGSRYDSNNWLIPIKEEAGPIFRQYPQETAIEIATAVLKTNDTGETHLPWTTVFPSDDKKQIGTRLLGVLQTPDYQTPAYDPEIQGAVQDLRALLGRHNATGLFGKHAAYCLVQTAAGKEENFLTYQDMGRKWPQHANDWINSLQMQFGIEGYEEIRQADPGFAALLGRTGVLTRLHYERQGRVQQPGEPIGDFIDRIAEMFHLTSVEGLAEASRVLGYGLEGYRKAAYSVRGLPEPIPE